MADSIFHLALPDDWRRAVDEGRYTMSTRGLGLDEVGYIHCSTPRQAVGVAQRYYDDVPTLIVLEIDPTAVDAEIVWEPPAPDVDDLFPHIYGPLPVGAVTAATERRRGADAWSSSALFG